MPEAANKVEADVDRTGVRHTPVVFDGYRYTLVGDIWIGALVKGLRSPFRGQTEKLFENAAQVRRTAGAVVGSVNGAGFTGGQSLLRLLGPPESPDGALLVLPKRLNRLVRVGQVDTVITPEVFDRLFAVYVGNAPYANGQGVPELGHIASPAPKQWKGIDVLHVVNDMKDVGDSNAHCVIPERSISAVAARLRGLNAISYGQDATTADKVLWASKRATDADLGRLLDLEPGNPTPAQLLRSGRLWALTDKTTRRFTVVPDRLFDCAQTLSLDGNILESTLLVAASRFLVGTAALLDAPAYGFPEVSPTPASGAGAQDAMTWARSNEVVSRPLQAPLAHASEALDVVIGDGRSSQGVYEDLLLCGPALGIDRTELGRPVAAQQIVAARDGSSDTRVISQALVCASVVNHTPITQQQATRAYETYEAAHRALNEELLYRGVVELFCFPEQTDPALRDAIVSRHGPSDFRLLRALGAFGVIEGVNGRRGSAAQVSDSEARSMSRVPRPARFVCDLLSAALDRGYEAAGLSDQKAPTIDFGPLTPGYFIGNSRNAGATTAGLTGP